MVTKTGKFENIGENFLMFDMNLGSYISLEDEFSKSSKVSLIQIIPLFIQLTFAKHLPLNFIYLFPHVNCFPISLKLCVLLFLPHHVTRFNKNSSNSTKVY
jgi:hypothetical protein